MKHSKECSDLCFQVPILVAVLTSKVPVRFVVDITESTVFVQYAAVSLLVVDVLSSLMIGYGYKVYTYIRSPLTV